MLDAGVPIHKVRDWVGHKNISTTSICANTTRATWRTLSRRSSVVKLARRWCKPVTATAIALLLGPNRASILGFRSRGGIV